MKRIHVHGVRHSGTANRAVNKFAQKVWNGWRLNRKSAIFGNPKKAEPGRIDTLLP